MCIDLVRNVFLWCTIINYILLVVWFLFYVPPHETLFRLWGRWFHLTAEQFDAINFAGIAFYKLVALRVVG